MPVRFRLVIGIQSLCLTLSLCGQEVVFSRPVYKEQGQSYQQIWSRNPATDVLEELTHSARDHYHPACRDGSITFVSENAKLWNINPATGEERIIGPPPSHQPRPRKGCDVFAKTGNLEACGKGEDVSVSRDNKAIAHFKTDECPIDERGTIGKCESPIQSLEWSPDAKRLLVGALEDLLSEDYYIVDPAAMKLARVATALSRTALFGCPDALGSSTRRRNIPRHCLVRAVSAKSGCNSSSGSSPQPERAPRLPQALPITSTHRCATPSARLDRFQCASGG